MMCVSILLMRFITAFLFASALLLNDEPLLFSFINLISSPNSSEIVNSALIMFKIKRVDTVTLKISLGLFVSVIIYYINNFFLVMGNTERIPLIFAIFIPLLILSTINMYMVHRINEK